MLYSCTLMATVGVKGLIQVEDALLFMFLFRPMMAQHASESSVEDRIKRNIYSIQRTPADLDKNFARH